MGESTRFYALTSSPWPNQQCHSIEGKYKTMNRVEDSEPQALSFQLQYTMGKRALGP